MNQPPHPRPFSLERFASGELAGHDHEQVEGHLVACAQCRSLVAQLEEDQSKFKREVPYGAFLAEHQRRLGKAKAEHGWAGWIGWEHPRRLLVPAAAAAVLALAFVLIPEPIQKQETIQIKGAPVSLEFYVGSGQNLAPGAAGQKVTPGAVLQISYDAATFGYLALLGVDSSGVVDVYFPSNPAQLAPVPSGARGTLPFSLTLDPTPGVERFVAVFGNHPAALDPVRAALAHAASLDSWPGDLLLPKDLATASFWVIKE